MYFVNEKGQRVVLVSNDGLVTRYLTVLTSLPHPAVCGERACSAPRVRGESGRSSAAPYRQNPISFLVSMEDDLDDADVADAIAALEKNNQPGKVQQPKPQLLPNRAAPSNIVVSTRQKGNPVLNNIRSLPWEYGDIQADFVLGHTTCAFFLSLKYHRLHPEYIYSRIKALGAKYNLRVLLTMVDIQNHEEPLKELSKTSLVNNLTLILCWSSQEAGRYLELFKSFEHASPQSIKAHQATSYRESLVDFITVPRSVNKTDAVSLVSNFGSIRAAVNARPEEIGMITGWGEKKVQRWYSTVNEPFRVTNASRRGLNREQSSLMRSATRPDDSDQSEGEPHQRLIPENPHSSRQPLQSSLPQKRSASDNPQPDDGSTDQALFLSDSEEDPASPRNLLGEASRSNDVPHSPTKRQAVMSDGIEAALAKLRDH